MAYTMAQRLAKQQLLLASREISRLTVSTARVELEERDIASWMFDRIKDYTKHLADAQKAGKLTGAEAAQLLDADGVARLFSYWADFMRCLYETKPTIERLGLLDSMTEGKGLQLYIPDRKTTG